MRVPEGRRWRGDPGATVAMFETLALGDLSLLIKFGVQFGLWGGAVNHLGTASHHERYLRQVIEPRAAGLLRDDRDRPRLERRSTPRPPPPTTLNVRSSSSTRRSSGRARSSSATPRAMVGWRRCLRS